MLKFFISFLPLIFIALAEEQGEYCYVKEEWPYYNFSHRTPYLATANRDAIQHPEGCVPHFLWAYVRHGTRYPSRQVALKFKTLEGMKNNILEVHETGKGVLHYRDAMSLDEWEFLDLLLDKDVCDQLSLQGTEDMAVLAGCFVESFPSLVRGPRGKYLYQASETKRTQESAVHFVNVLTKSDRAFMEAHNITINHLIRLHKHCPNYQNEQFKKEARQEVELFEISRHMNQTQIDVSKRLGFTNVIPYDAVETMYESCATESAWHLQKKAPFCAVFRKEDLKVFEYKEDLNLYWKNGYGNPLTEKLGCPMVRDMMTKISDAAKPDRSYFASIFFGHVQMILSVMVKLGLSHDEEPLKHDNYDKMKDDRKWRISYTGNFAANIVAVLYHCPDYEDGEYQVVIYQNGREVVIPKCGKSPCPWEKLKSHFPEVFDEKQCNADFC